jgi:RIO kinase 1
LNDIAFTHDEALDCHGRLLEEVVRMLCAGVVHGDLSEFNILLAADGPVIIDLPQAVDAAGNNHAARMLLHDVTNLRHCFTPAAPELRGTEYGAEIWSLCERGMLQPGVVLTGRYEHQGGTVDLSGLMREIEDAQMEEKVWLVRMAGA